MTHESSNIPSPIPSSLPQQTWWYRPLIWGTLLLLLYLLRDFFLIGFLTNYYPPLEAALVNHFGVVTRLAEFGALAWFFLPLLLLLPIKLEGTWNLTTHRIDPDVDDARDYVIEDLLGSGYLDRMGYVEGVEVSELAAPRRNLCGDPYVTDGNRAVLILSATTTTAKFLSWHLNGLARLSTTSELA